MAQFIKADDGRYINIDHIFEFVPVYGGDVYVAHYPGTDEYGDLASTEFSAATVRRVIASNSGTSKPKTGAV